MPVSEYTPTVADVAGYIRARTKTAGGSEAGTFNPATADGTSDMTRPNAEQVNIEITKSLRKITAVIGVDVPAAQQDAAKEVVALRAAMLTELQYWPEQVNTGRSTYPQLKDLYDEAWEDLASALGINTDDDGGAVPVDAGYPSYGGFPRTGIGMESPW